MLLELAKTMPIPDWAAYGTRFFDLYMNDLWLEGHQYDGIDRAFNDESTKSGMARRMWEKRPSVRLQLPAVAADVIQHKLFAPSRFPTIRHDNPKVIKAMKWLTKKAKLDRKMLDAAFWGQSGSVGATMKVVDGVPSVKLWSGKFCTPLCDESDNLERLIVHYPVSGAKWLSLGVKKDREGTDIDEQGDYWYIRAFDATGVYTGEPVLYADWNPVEHDVEDWGILAKLSVKHDVELEYPVAQWITNLSAGTGVDGRSTFGLALPNCIHIDWTLSQMGRGLNAASSPTLVVKGRVLNYEKSGQVVLGPSGMIQLSEDRQEGPGMGRSGSDAKYLEMSGGAIQIGMEHWVKDILHWTKDLLNISRKDPDTISGAISGKALELINEPFLEAVLVQRLAYGDYGYLPTVQNLACMMIKLGEEPRFKDVTETDIEECELEWPDFYQASPQEAQPLVTALTTAVAAGFEDAEVAKTYWRGQMGIRHNAIEDEDDESGDSEAEEGRQKALEALGKAPKPEAENEGTSGGVKTKKPKAKAKSPA